MSLSNLQAFGALSHGISSGIGNYDKFQHNRAIRRQNQLKLQLQEQQMRQAEAAKVTGDSIVSGLEEQFGLVPASTATTGVAGAQPASLPAADVSAPSTGLVQASQPTQQAAVATPFAQSDGDQALQSSESAAPLDGGAAIGGGLIRAGQTPSTPISGQPVGGGVVGAK